jgi:hypothetical protein
LKSDIGAEAFKDSVYPQADAVGWAAVAAAGGAGLVAGGEGFGDLFRQMVSYVSTDIENCTTSDTEK